MSGRLRRRTWLGAALLGPALWMVSGCVNLDDVCGLTRLAQRAEKMLPAISNDVAATCIRRNVYFDNIPSDEKHASDVAVDCGPYKDVSEHLAADQRVLTEYFEALGTLASNKPLSYATTITADLKEIDKMPGLATDTAKASSAAAAIAKTLADATTHGYRERQVNEVIKANDEAVQDLALALKRVITRDYPILLGGEQNYMDLFYQGPLAAQRNERLALILVQRQYAGDKARLQAHKDSIVSYAKVMDDLSKLHSKLKQEADAKVSLAQIAKEVGPTVSALKESISALESETK